MTKKYQNIGFAANKAQFIDATSNPVGANGLLFANEVKLAPLAGGGKRQMVSGSLTVNVPISVDATVTGQPATVLNESLKLQWNFSRGGLTVAAMRAEINRVFDEAVAKYNLTQGLVPPVQSDFAGA